MEEDMRYARRLQFSIEPTRRFHTSNGQPNDSAKDQPKWLLLEKGKQSITRNSFPTTLSSV